MISIVTAIGAAYRFYKLLKKGGDIYNKVFDAERVFLRAAGKDKRDYVSQLILAELDTWSKRKTGSDIPEKLRKALGLVIEYLVTEAVTKMSELGQINQHKFQKIN